MMLAINNCEAMNENGLRHFAVAPHGFLPLICDDKYPEQRKAALSFGKGLIRDAYDLAVGGSEVTSGMLEEIEYGIKLDKPILFESEPLYRKFLEDYPLYAPHVQLDGHREIYVFTDSFEDIMRRAPSPLDISPHDIADIAIEMAEGFLMDAKNIISPPALRRLFNDAIESAAQGVA